MMKEYKIDLSMLEGEAREDVSATIQRHAFRLGYAWLWVEKKPQYKSCPVLYFEKNGRILKDEDADRFNKRTNTEISITDFLALKPEDVKDAPCFKPFDRVLVRDCDGGEWRCDFFDSYNEESEYRYYCTGDSYRQCIPYEGNEHLRGTTEDAK